MNEYEHRAWMLLILSTIIIVHSVNWITIACGLFFGFGGVVNMARSIWLDWRESS